MYVEFMCEYSVWCTVSKSDGVIYVCCLIAGSITPPDLEAEHLDG